MAFEISKERYASFGVATSLPHEIIDTFWDILDNYLKGVIPLESIISFHLTEKKGKLTICYQNQKQQTTIAFDYNYGSIISVVGKSTVEIMEPFLV